MTAYTYEKAPRPAMIRNASLTDLLNLWDETERASYTAELPTVRGWLMDELHDRNPQAFTAWMENENYDDPELDSPSFYFC